MHDPTDLSPDFLGVAALIARDFGPLLVAIRHESRP